MAGWLVRWLVRVWRGRPCVRYDRAYGWCVVWAPRICRVLRSEGFCRLQRVFQAGTPALVGWCEPVTRAEHCFGAMWLVRQAGGSQDEQLAALLHDTTHRAFSHIVDVLFREELQGESLHEKGVEQFVGNTDIPEAVGTGWEALYDDSRWPLLEQPSPALCADRGDYVPRDCLGIGLVTPQWTRFYLRHIGTHDGRLVLRSRAAARDLCLLSLAIDRDFYRHPRGIGLYEATACLLRRALSTGLITRTDLDRKGDADIFACAQAHAHSDPALRRWLAVIAEEERLIRSGSGKSLFRVVGAGQPPRPGATLLKGGVKCKVRWIDPAFVDPPGSAPQRVSQVDDDVAEALRRHTSEGGGLFDIHLLECAQ